jgi:DNA mismatch endonuclease (patch repair protein)
MVDIMSKATRSRVMRRIRSRDTKPELIVRRLIHAMGYRYRLHDRRLPGCPDLVFRKRRKVIFVHGCFWHRHKECPTAQLPKSRREFWTPKLNANRKRDAKNIRELEQGGWCCLVIWECEVGDQANIEHRIRTFLDDSDV